MIMQLHGLDKDIIEKYDSIASSLGFKSRSETMRYMLNYFVEYYNYLTKNNALIYCLIEYEQGSYAGQDIINMQQRFNSMKIIDNDKYGEHYFMVFRISSSPSNINNIIKMFINIRGIYKFKIMVI